MEIEKQNDSDEEIDFEKFARLIAILLEELNNPSK